MLADVWAQLDAVGAITSVHVIYTYLDGTFVQEVLENTQTSTVINSQAYAVFLPKPLPPD